MGRRRIYRDHAARQRAYYRRRKQRLRRYPGLAKLDKLPPIITPADVAIRHCSMSELLSSFDGTIDAIITDPPYSRDSIPLYGELARLAKTALKSDGILAVMCGQAWLPEVLAAMTPHLRYRWTLIYETPGQAAAKLMDRHVLSRWKPVLLFGGKRQWVCNDVISGARDKSAHHWQQSVSGMSALIEALTQPGDLIADPLCGAGSTALAAMQTGRRFVGCDIDETAVRIARYRISETAP